MPKERVRFHGRRVTKVGPEVKHGLFHSNAWLSASAGKTKAPDLVSASIVMRAQSYRRRMDAEFDTAADILFP
jgi:hypothetical protein